MIAGMGNRRLHMLPPLCPAFRPWRGSMRAMSALCTMRPRSSRRTRRAYALLLPCAACAHGRFTDRLTRDAARSFPKGPEVMRNPSEPHAGPLLSVVIPFYNEAESIEMVCTEAGEVLSSVADLSWELIMVDDCSTDGTAAIMDGLVEKNERFIAVHIQPHSGQSAALEAGFANASGVYIATLDGDGRTIPGHPHPPRRDQ